MNSASPSQPDDRDCGPIPLIVPAIRQEGDKLSLFGDIVIRRGFYFVVPWEDRYKFAEQMVGVRSNDSQQDDRKAD